MRGSALTHCPTCGVEQPQGHKFCEECGASLRAPPTPAASRDRMEVVAAPHLAGVTDRGKHHPHNDDFLALVAHARGDVLVVCDGVSSSQTAARAAELGARAACASLVEALTSGAPAGLELVKGALSKAEAAVRELPYNASLPGEPPETTIVAALRHGGRLYLGWLGDSRAYLIGPGSARQLTEDHSWINEVVAAGEMTPAEAARAPEAACITRTLGGRSKADEPGLLSLDLPEGPALLLLCTDGLWNYLAGPERLAELVRTPAARGALAVAHALIAHVLAQRAHDNVTAAVLALPNPGARP